MDATADDLAFADLLNRAACGDPDAQVEMSKRALAEATAEPASSNHTQCIYVAEVFARMAACHGRSQDRFQLACALTAKANFSLSQDCPPDYWFHAGEALMLFNQLADEGDDDAFRNVELIVERMPPGFAECVSDVIRDAADATQNL